MKRSVGLPLTGPVWPTGAPGAAVQHASPIHNVQAAALLHKVLYGDTGPGCRNRAARQWRLLVTAQPTIYCCCCSRSSSSTDIFQIRNCASVHVLVRTPSQGLDYDLYLPSASLANSPWTGLQALQWSMNLDAAAAATS
jgi:hypothetical protein